MAVTCSSPEQVHLAFGNDETQMTVSWASNDTKSAFVEYGTSETVLSSVTNGTTQTCTAGGWKGYLHHADLSGLDASTTYFYRVGGLSEVFSFRTKPGKEDRTPVKIIAYGDMGTPGDVHGPGANYTVEFCESVIEDLDFVLHVGDIPYDKGDEFVWDGESLSLSLSLTPSHINKQTHTEFFRGVQGYAASVPYMVCPGNEDHAYDFVGYLSRFRMPGSKSLNSSWFYSFDYSYVHVISISTEYISREPGSEQYEFLEADLKNVNRTATPFVVMIGHRPLYCSSNDYYDCNMWAPRARETLEPLLSQYDVDLYICGHVHSYERTYPVLNGTRVSETYANPNATTHVMVGGAGAGLSKTWSHDQPEWSASRIINYAVGMIEIPDETTMHWKLVSTHTSGTDGQGGEVLDQITITK